MSTTIPLPDAPAASVAARSTGGRRKAVKPGRAPRERAPREPRPAPPAAGRRARTPFLRGLPAAPTLVGVAALAVAAAGAVTVSVPQDQRPVSSGSITRLAGHAGATTGASSSVTAGALSGRERAVSRDSQREALADAADADLQAAAEQQAKERNAALQSLAASAEKQASTIAKNAWQLPVETGVYHLTSRFGECSLLWSHCHTGLDFAAPTGTPIHAIANGTVTSTQFSGAYGNRTIVTLEDGTALWYCHQTSYAVHPGDKVLAGQVIGAVGSTGNVTGPHVHVEVRPGAGDPVDPYQAMLAHGLKP